MGLAKCTSTEILGDLTAELFGDLHCRIFLGDLNVWGDLISVGGPSTPVGTQPKNPENIVKNYSGNPEIVFA